MGRFYRQKQDQRKFPKRGSRSWRSFSESVRLGENRHLRKTQSRRQTMSRSGDECLQSKWGSQYGNTDHFRRGAILWCVLSLSEVLVLLQEVIASLELCHAVYRT